MSHDFLVTVLLLSNLRKMRVFSFYVTNVIGFQKFFTSLAQTLSNPLQPKTYFSSKLHQFQVYICKISSRYAFLIPSLIIFLGLCRFQLKVLYIGDFSKIGWVLSFCEIFSKFLIGLSPICCDCSCVGPLWQFEHVLRKISLCSCILHHLCTLLHVRCLTKCPSDIFVLNQTQVSSNAQILS